MITIFTPTYNRAHLLPRVFNSLLQQVSKDFEWVVVDDGSSDNTEVLFPDFKNKADFPIQYFKQKNGGKHRAINKGVSMANGDFIIILDTDDFLSPEAVSFVKEKTQNLTTKDTAGIAGRRIYQDGKITGSNNFDFIHCTSLDIRYKYHVTGDLVEVFKTEVLKEFPFPEIEEERFCPEALVWNRIAQKYPLDFYNQGFYVTEYLPGGLTEKIVRIRMTSPIASMIHYAELASYQIPFKEKIKASINFWRFSFNSKMGFGSKLKQTNPLMSFFTLPIGLLMYINDKRKNK